MKTNWCFAQKNKLNEPDVRILIKRNEKDFDGTTKVENTDDRGGETKQVNNTDGGGCCQP